MRKGIATNGHLPTRLEFPLVTMDTYLASSPELARREFEGPAFVMHRLMSEANDRLPAAPTAAALAREAATRKTSLVTDPRGAVRFLRNLKATVGVGHFVAATAQGGLDHELVLASMTLFAREVMDVLRTDADQVDPLGEAVSDLVQGTDPPDRCSAKQ